MPDRSIAPFPATAPNSCAVKSFNLPQYRPKGVRAPLTIAMSPAFNMMDDLAEPRPDPARVISPNPTVYQWREEFTTKEEVRSQKSEVRNQRSEVRSAAHGRRD